MMDTLARPEVEYDESLYSNLVDAYRHEDGSISYVVYDDDAEHANPRDCDGNLAVLIQQNSRCVDIDTDDAGLSEARERFDCYGRHGTSAHGYGHGAKVRLDREAMMKRYIAMFRPDVAHYEDWWSAGRDSYGWGYVLTETWNEHMFPSAPSDDTVEGVEEWLNFEPSCTPEEAFDAEVDVFGQWCDGEVYGVHHVTIGEPIVTYGEHGAYVDGYETEEDSCWGFLGYNDRTEIAMQFTSSPITEVLY